MNSNNTPEPSNNDSSDSPGTVSDANEQAKTPGTLESVSVVAGATTLFVFLIFAVWVLIHLTSGTMHNLEFTTFSILSEQFGRYAILASVIGSLLVNGIYLIRGGNDPKDSMVNKLRLGAQGTTVASSTVLFISSYFGFNISPFNIFLPALLTVGLVFFNCITNKIKSKQTEYYSKKALGGLYLVITLGLLYFAIDVIRFLDSQVFIFKNIIIENCEDVLWLCELMFKP